MSAACSAQLFGFGILNVRIRSGRRLRSSAFKSPNVGTLGLECVRRGTRFLPECPRDFQSRCSCSHSIILASVLRACRNSSDVRRRSAILSRVKRPCLTAFLFPSGAPDPGAPPCMRQRRLPLTAGDLQEPPERVRAPQRILDSIRRTLRL